MSRHDHERLSETLGSPQSPASRSSRLHFARRLVQDSVYRTAFRNLSLILLWYTLSTTLSLYNKKLVGKEHGVLGRGAFPAPLLLTSTQFFLQTLLAKLALATGLAPRTQEKPSTWKEWYKTVLPNGVTTGLDIGLSNLSMAYITLSFYTMCKSTTPIFLLLFAFIWRLERPSWNLAGVVGMMVTGLILLVMGEMTSDTFHASHFKLGFTLVISASCLSGLRFTLTQVLLQGSGAHGGGRLGGPVELLEALTPLMGVTVLVASLASEHPWHSLPESPYFASVSHTLVTFGIIGVGAVLAFCMVWTEFAVIQLTSALTFMVAGTMKEVVTVMAAILVMHDRFTAVNAIGLVIVMGAVMLFNMLKLRKIQKGELRAGRVTKPAHREEEDIDVSRMETSDVHDQDTETAVLLPKSSVIELKIGPHEPSIR